ncbi:hypothetical protein HN587_02800 [Candidatus Woesearchaeota archaeon]|jgi:hypothetical protein|nr:hypothetical protein [Candidatus Woesearchaeota archaeon]
MNTFGRLTRKSVPSNYRVGTNRSISDLKKYEVGTRLNELIHAPQIIWNAYELVQHVSNGNTGSAFYWGALLFVNTYCTLLQRYNRARVYNTLEQKGLDV